MIFPISDGLVAIAAPESYSVTFEGFGTITLSRRRLSKRKVQIRLLQTLYARLNTLGSLHNE